MKQLARAMLGYARHGWPVFPIQPRGKAPLTDDGFKAATTDEAQLAGWWARWPEANIGFVPGRAGLVVLDIDGPEGESAAQRLGLLAEPTLTIATARGVHLYFRHPGGHIGNRRLAPGLDVRADAGYVLLPPSVHPSGARYRCILGTVDGIIPLPPDALEALRPPRREPRAYEGPPVNAGTPRRRAYVTAAIEAECLELASTGEGNRNNRLNTAAYSLARFVETGEADPGKLADALTYAARNTGLGDEEIERTIRSAFGARGVAA